MDEKLKEAIKTANTLINLKLYNIEYLDDLENKFKFTNVDKFVEQVLDVLIACIRVEDNKIVFLKKNARKAANKSKYLLYVPLELPKDEVAAFIEEDKIRKSNHFAATLKNVATIFYGITVLFIIVGLSLAFEEGGIIFISVIIGALGIVFMGMILHALSFLLINTAKVNQKK